MSGAVVVFVVLIVNSEHATAHGTSRSVHLLGAVFVAVAVVVFVRVNTYKTRKF